MEQVSKSIPLWPTAGSDPSDPVICALDLGSKNFKLMCGYETENGVQIRTLNKITLNLGQEILESGGEIRRDKLAEVEHVLAAFGDYGRSKNLPRFMAIATSAVRDARNGWQLVDIARKHGIDLEIADGRREGQVGYLAATHGKPNRLVAELGSRSAQVTWHDGSRIHVRRLEMGYQAAYRSYFHADRTFAAAAQKFRAFLRPHFQNLPRDVQECIALAGNSAAGFVFAKLPQGIEQARLPHTSLRNRIAELQGLGEADFLKLEHETGKAEKVFPGLVFLDCLLEATGHSQISISRAELPEGLIVEQLNGAGQIVLN